MSPYSHSYIPIDTNIVLNFTNILKSISFIIYIMHAVTHVSIQEALSDNSYRPIIDHLRYNAFVLPHFTYCCVVWHYCSDALSTTCRGFKIMPCTLF